MEPPETNRNICFLESSYLCVNSSLEELIKIKVIIMYSKTRNV